MDQHICLAYDGSINADWVARYAMRMAARTSRQRLVLLHVPDLSTPLASVELKIEAILAECRQQEIDCRPRILRPAPVARSIIEAVPAGRDHLCICGTRMKNRGRGILSGTVAERLLREARCATLAVRVASPGLLGSPSALLLPFGGHAGEFQAILPLLPLLGPDSCRLNLLRVMSVAPLWHRFLTPGRRSRLRERGRRFLERFAGELSPLAAANHWHQDRSVVVSSSWPREILIQAGKLRSELILMGFTAAQGIAARIAARRIEYILRYAPCDVALFRSP